MRILTALALLTLFGNDGGLGLPTFAPGEELLYEVTMLGAHVGTLRIAWCRIGTRARNT